MRYLLFVVLGLASLACVPPAASPGTTAGLVRPGGAPSPSTPDPSMPASLPPPPSATAVGSDNPTYKLGTNFAMAGGALVVAGATFTVLGLVLPCKASDPNCDPNSNKRVGDLLFDLGIGSLIVGGVALAVGIPLLIVGANQVRQQLEKVGFGPKGLRIAF